MAKKYKNNDLHGVINVYKEKGYTSHDVVAIITKLTGAKAGHTGTLDPNAEGVLPICLGKATKLSGYIMADEKEYRGEVILGSTTDTEDSTGNLLTQTPVSSNFEEIEAAVYSFKGEYLQTPPMYSAIKINGQKLYDMARQGKEVERTQRLVNIADIEILNFYPPNKIELNVTCSKGTYIRTLCADIGEKLGCGGHMGNLLRTRTGNFLLKNSSKLDEIRNIIANGKLNDIIIGYDKILTGYKKAAISEAANKHLYNGNKININYSKGDDFAMGDNVIVYDYSGNLVGIFNVICEQDQMFLRPVTMLVPSRI